MRRCGTLLFAVVLIAVGLPAGAASFELVACAPGYPGTTEQAQPTMDDLAERLTQLAGWNPERLSAIYFPDLNGGLERLASDSAAVAMVPLPFWLRYREELGLEPLVEALPTSGETETWSLVAVKGALGKSDSLDGWEVVGAPGYAPEFVRRVALAGRGELGEKVSVRFTSRVISSLRKAAAGEKIAVLLDQAQVAALPSLPFGDSLEVVSRSDPMPASVVCTVSGRLAPDAAKRLADSLIALSQDDAGSELLEALRMRRFAEIGEGVGRAWATYDVD